MKWPIYQDIRSETSITVVIPMQAYRRQELRNTMLHAIVVRLLVDGCTIDCIVARQFTMAPAFE